MNGTMARRGRSFSVNQGYTFFVTTTVMNFDHVFDCGEQYYHILLNSLKHVVDEQRVTLLAYVFMPSHVHFVVNLPPGESVSDMMRDFKKYTSTRVRQQLERDDQVKWIERLRANVGRKLPTSRTPGGVRTSVLTLHGDDSKSKPLTSLRKKQVFKLWMDRFDDVVIYTEKMLSIKIMYIHENPVRAGLVKRPEDWKYSSARNYTFGDQTLINVATDWELRDIAPEVIPEPTKQHMRQEVIPDATLPEETPDAAEKAMGGVRTFVLTQRSRQQESRLSETDQTV